MVITLNGLVQCGRSLKYPSKAIQYVANAISGVFKVHALAGCKAWLELDILVVFFLIPVLRFLIVCICHFLWACSVDEA